MQIWLKTVTRAWAKVVARLACPDLVNVWQVGAHRVWRGAAPGDLVLFRPRKGGRAIVGYARFIATTTHSPREIWDLLHFSNGAWSLDGFLAQVKARARNAEDQPQALSNALLAAPVFFPPLNPFDLPHAFPVSTNGAPLCRARDKGRRILIASLRYHEGRSLHFGETPQVRLLGYRMYRVPGTVVRVDGRARRSVLSELSGHRCAISGDPVTLTLDAAHAWPLQYGGPDDLGNLMLLATRLHRLWEKGLIGVDDAHRIMVSAELLLYEVDPIILSFAGQPLRRRRSGNPYPDEANLWWHRNHLFHWPKYTPDKRWRSPLKS